MRPQHPPSHSLIRRRGFIAAAGMLSLSACVPGRELPELQQVVTGPYQLGPGDQLRLITFNEPELTGQFSVADTGLVALPLVGNIRAQGLTETGLSMAISDTLKAKGLLKDPSVSVQVTNFRPVYVLGEVAKPGQFPFEPGMTVLTLVAVAGGYTYRAVTDHASVLRTSKGVPVEARATPDRRLQPGDVVTIYERLF